MSSRLVGMTAWVSGLQKSSFWPKNQGKTKEKQRFSDSGLWPGLGGRAKRKELVDTHKTGDRLQPLLGQSNDDRPIDRPPSTTAAVTTARVTFTMVTVAVATATIAEPKAATPPPKNRFHK